MTESRALGAGLLVSLLINAFLIGALITRWTQADAPRMRPGMPPAGPPPILNLRRLTGDLAPELRTRVDAAFREQRGAMREQMAAIVAQRHRVREALAAEDFDPEVLRAALSRLRELDGAAARRTHDALVELAASLDGPGRRALAEAMNRRPRRPPPLPEPGP